MLEFMFQDLSSSDIRKTLTKNLDLKLQKIVLEYSITKQTCWNQSTWLKLYNKVRVANQNTKLLHK